MKRRIIRDGRIYVLGQMYTFNEEGKKAAIRDARAWRERGHWAFVRKGKDVSTYHDYPAVYVGPVWAVYRSVKKKER